MSWFNNLGMKVKLIGGFSVAALITAVVAVFGITTLKTADNADTRLYEVGVVPSAAVADATSGFLGVRMELRNALLAQSPEGIRQAESKIATQYLKIDSGTAALGRQFATEASANGDSIRAALTGLAASLGEYKPVVTQIIEQAKAGRVREAVALMNSASVLATAGAVAARIDEVAANYAALGKTISDANTVAANRASTIMLVILAIGVIFCLLLGLFISTVIAKPLGQGVEMMKEMAVGRLGRRLKLGRKDEIGVLADTMDVFAENLQTSVLGTMKKIAAGDLSTDVKMEDAKDEIAPALQLVTTSLRGLVAEAGMLSKAAVEGKLATRGDATKYQGAYRDIVKGVNDCLDAVIGPLNVAAEYVDRISKGDIPPKITDNYNGDFNEIKNNLNTAIEAVNHLVADAGLLSKAAVEGKLATRADATKHQGAYRDIVKGVDDCLDAVIGPLNVAAEYVDRISKGDIPPKITDSYNGDFNEIKNNLNAAIEAVNHLVADAGLLSKAAVEGKLATRADATKHQGSYRDIVKGVNDCLDSVIGPLNVAAEYVDRISKGDIPPKITDSYNGDFNEIKNNLNAAIGAVNALVADAGLLSKAAVDGKLATRADATKHQGSYRDIVQGVDNCLDAVIGPLNVAAEYVDRISKGDIPPKITDNYNGDFNEIKNNLNAAIEAVNHLVADAGLLSKAAVEGKLATRADATKHQGSYRDIVKGVNDCLDSVIGPLNVAAEYVDRISKGDIPPKITDNYNGDFNEIKNNLNAAIGAVNALVADAGLLSKAAVAGKLATRADATKHQGSYRDIVQGVNDCLDSVIGPLNVAAEYVDRISKGDIPPKITDSYNGDFNEIKNNLNVCIDAVDALVADAGALGRAAVEGKLTTRADATKHQGDYRKIVQGVNDTLDAVILPVNEAAKVLESMARRDLTQRVMGDYQGDHANIKNALNGALEAVQGAVSQLAGSVTMIASSAEEMSAVSATMGSNAEETSAQSNVASAAAEQVSKNVQTVATGTEEMSASIREIAKNASEAARIASSAVEVAERTNATVAKLGVSSTEIGNVIKVITSIAEQTNLLALNATIEAARAGEAGKGFAVVANEVKELAKETAKATEDIGGKIAAIQSDTEAAVAAIGQIAGVINQINDISNTIASAVEEQTATTNEIGRNVAEAATGSNEIAKNITSVSVAAQSTSQGAANSQTASAELARMAGELQKLVDQFHYEDGTQQATGPRLHVKKSKAA